MQEGKKELIIWRTVIDNIIMESPENLLYVRPYNLQEIYTSLSYTNNCSKYWRIEINKLVSLENVFLPASLLKFHVILEIGLQSQVRSSSGESTLLFP